MEQLQDSRSCGACERAEYPWILGSFRLLKCRGALFTPQVGGAGAVPPGTIGNAFTAFRIDHDEKFNQTTHFQYQPWERGPWVGFNWRYDSGLVAGAVPVADASGT